MTASQPAPLWSLPFCTNLNNSLTLPFALSPPQHLLLWRRQVSPLQMECRHRPSLRLTHRPNSLRCLPHHPRSSRRLPMDPPPPLQRRTCPRSPSTCPRRWCPSTRSCPTTWTHLLRPVPSTNTSRRLTRCPPDTRTTAWTTRNRRDCRRSPRRDPARAVPRPRRTTSWTPPWICTTQIPRTSQLMSSSLPSFPSCGPSWSWPTPRQTVSLIRPAPYSQRMTAVHYHHQHQGPSVIWRHRPAESQRCISSPRSPSRQRPSWWRNHRRMDTTLPCGGPIDPFWVASSLAGTDKEWDGDGCVCVVDDCRQCKWNKQTDRGANSIQFNWWYLGG